MKNETIETFAYRQFLTNFNVLLKEINELPISKITGEFINAKPLTEIDSVEILNQYNFNQSKDIPGFVGMMKAGINLLAQMKPNEEIESELNNITNFIATYKQSTFETHLPLIAYSSKQRQFIITENGLQSMDTLQIHLNAEQSETYRLIKGLASHLKPRLNNYSNSLYKFISSDCINRNEVDYEELARLIRYHSKP